MRDKVKKSILCDGSWICEEGWSRAYDRNVAEQREQRLLSLSVKLYV